MITQYRLTNQKRRIDEELCQPAGGTVSSQNRIMVRSLYPFHYRANRENVNWAGMTNNSGKEDGLVNNSPLHFQLLEAPLLIKNYVAGDAACNYEAYLTEILWPANWKGVCRFAAEMDQAMIDQPLTDDVPWESFHHLPEWELRIRTNHPARVFHFYDWTRLSFVLYLIW